MNTFYLDMDGVVADWTLAASKILGRPMVKPDPVTGFSTTPEEYNRIRIGHQRFYRDLPLMPRVDDLVTLARAYRDQLGWSLLFLTAVPKDNDVPWAFSDKVLWAQDHFPDIPVHFGPYSTDKHLHCRSGDILVDDRQDNCDQWTEAGGKSFHVTDNNLSSVIDLVYEDLNRRISFRDLRMLSVIY